MQSFGLSFLTEDFITSIFDKPLLLEFSTVDFEHGTLDVPEGTTLRTLLSKVLNCDPMRITKKYTGNSSIGKRTFVPLVRTPENSIFMDMSQQDLRELRSVWINKLLLMEQWNNRKVNLMKGIYT
jgi:hypothetical protein